MAIKRKKRLVPDTYLPIELDSQALISAQNLTVQFGGLPAIENVNVSIKAGEIVTVIGPNGAGKSTLVRALLGLVTPTGGSIHRRPDVRIGYVPQYVSVDDTLPLTVERFLRLGAPANQARLEKVLAEVGASDVILSPFQKISGGERRRVLLARALLRDPDLLVLDEPVQGVDFSGELDLYELIARIRDRRGCGVLLVSHDLHLVMASTDRVVCLNHHICCAGHPEVVKRYPVYLALFGSRAAESLAVYAHDHDLSGDVVEHNHP